MNQNSQRLWSFMCGAAGAVLIAFMYVSHQRGMCCNLIVAFVNMDISIHGLLQLGPSGAILILIIMALCVSEILYQ